MNRRDFLALAGAAAIAPTIAKAKPFGDYRDYVAKWAGDSRSLAIKARSGGEFSFTTERSCMSVVGLRPGSYVFILSGAEPKCLGRITKLDATGTLITVTGEIRSL